MLIMLMALAAQDSAAVARAEDWAKKAKPVAACSSPEDCDAKWKRASEWVRANSRFQIAVDRPDLLATYGAVYANTDLSFVIARRSEAGGATQIVARAWCGNVLTCHPKPKAAMSELSQALR